MKKTVFCLVSVLLVAFQSYAQAQVHIEGALTDCGDWIQARQQNRSVVLESYIIGYLGGFSSGSHREFWSADGRNISREAVYLWMDNYCRSNPLNVILTGVHTLFNERARQ